ENTICAIDTTKNTADKARKTDWKLTSKVKSRAQRRMMALVAGAGAHYLSNGTGSGWAGAVRPGHGVDKARTKYLLPTKQPIFVLFVTTSIYPNPTVGYKGWLAGSSIRIGTEKCSCPEISTATKALDKHLYIDHK
ncbi:hypothetical protein J6590_029387, partial [Homalodisca vitripennis]